MTEHADDPRLVAVGEIGLDLFVQGLDAERQQFFYTAQLKLAKRFGLPVILHVRRSADQLLKGLRRHPALLLRPDEVSSRIAHASILEVADHAFGGALQHVHMLVRRLA